jgi:SprT protein
LVLFVLVFYKDKQFQNNPLPQKTIKQLQAKNYEIKQTIKKLYNKDISIPIIIEDQLPNNLFGLASYKQGKIKILLNKKRFQENDSYMVNSVLPHEYAHALMFYFGNFTKVNGGHTKMWQKICLDIGGLKCDRFVDHNDILIEKLGGIY